jgi:hypothetical protein
MGAPLVRNPTSQGLRRGQLHGVVIRAQARQSEAMAAVRLTVLFLHIGRCRTVSLA